MEPQSHYAGLWKALTEESRTELRELALAGMPVPSHGLVTDLERVTRLVYDESDVETVALGWSQWRDHPAVEGLNYVHQPFLAWLREHPEVDSAPQP